MTAPRVWSKRKGAPSPPPGAVYVGRPSLWGNPYKVPLCVRSLPIEEQHRLLVEQYGQWLRVNPELVARVRRELAGKHLVCWCAPLPCHADILLRVAAGEEP